jgi:hypothetical protein
MGFRKKTPQSGQTKKGKTIDLGLVKSGEYGKFITFDSTVKEVQITREYEVDGETIVQVVKVGKNEKGYLNPVNIETPESRAEFRLAKGWIQEDQAEKLVNNAEKYGISSYLSVKVE